MGRLASPYSLIRRKDSKTYRLTLNPSCGLPERVCDEWFRCSFKHFPPELADYRNPKSKPIAEAGALALILYLKKGQEEGNALRVRAQDILSVHGLRNLRSLNRLLRESFEYNMSNVHTCFPGVVIKYDANTRRADIQPSLKRKMPDGEFMDFPVLPDIPIQFPGTKECTIHFPLEKDDEVSVHVIERSTDKWRDTGGAGIEDTDPRRFNLMDCYAEPGLQPIEFPETPETGISILYNSSLIPPPLQYLL